MKKKLFTALAMVFLVGLVCVFNNNCSACSTKKQVRNTRIQQVSKVESEVQEKITRLEIMKAEVEKHYAIYKQSIKKSGSLLDNKESEISADQILRSSKTLLSFSEKCLNAKETIRQVSGAGEQFSEYRDYARKMIEEFKGSE